MKALWKAIKSFFTSSQLKDQFEELLEKEEVKEPVKPRVESTKKPRKPRATKKLNNK